MTKKVVTCSNTTSILEVRGLMGKHRISRVVVVNMENKPVGIITQKDIVRFLIADKSKRGLEEMPAEEVMTGKDLITIDSSASISGIAGTMVKRNLSSLIVVEEDGKLAGIVTKADLNLYFASKGGGIFKVQDYMTANPKTVMPSQSIYLVVNLMSENKISRVIVADDEKKPVGIITLADVTMIGSLLKPPKILMEGRPVIVGGAITLPSSIHLLAARDIMVAPPISIDKDSDLSDAAKLMTRHNISGLPVVNDSGSLVGIVTKSDITRAIASIKE